MYSSAQVRKPIVVLLAALHAAAGFSLNYFFPLSLFLGVNAYLGSFFGFMAFIYQGPGIGIAALAAAAAGAALRGDLGYTAAVFFEVAVVAFYYPRRKRSIAFADAMFWVVPGTLIVAAARLAEGLPLSESILSGATISVFAIFASTLASLLADYARRVPANAAFASMLGPRGDVPFRRIVFTTSCALAMTPFLLFMVVTSDSRTRGLELEIGKRLDTLSETYSLVAPLWVEVKKTPLESIERSVSSGIGEALLVGMLATLRATGSDIASIGVLDAAGRIAAVDADPGLRPSDRPGSDMSATLAYRNARSTASLSLSAEADAAGRPLVCFVLPFGGGSAGGYGGGAAFSLFKPDTISALLNGIAAPTLCRGWLIAPDGAVVAASDPGDPDGFRKAIRVERGASPRIKGSSREIARSTYAQFAEVGIGAGWKAAFVQGIGPLRASVVAFALALALFALVSIASIVAASAYTSKIVVSSLDALGEATRRFKERFIDREAAPLAESAAPPIAWPSDGIQEVVAMSRAFQEAGELLDRRYRETLAALGEAERADRAKRDLLSAVSHDIRGPMGGIVGVAEKLEKELGEGPAAADARLIKETGANLGVFVEDLLDSSSLEDGRLELRSEAFDLRALFAAAVSVFHAAARRKGLALEHSFDERIPSRVVGDRARLFQVLGNLIGNAVKYTSAGSVKVSASLQAQSALEAVVLFEVADTGMGIPPEDLRRVFDPYFRSGGGAARAEAGSGLGLALARGLVRLMGSDISVESEVGAGSVFRFAVALAASDEVMNLEGAELPRAGAAARSSAGPPIGARVLVVDDMEIGRRHSRRVLELAGCVVEEASDGASAVEAALRSDFDLILMDMDLPSLDGRSAAREIRSRLDERGAARLPLMVALTAYAADGDEESIIAAGFDGYIAKDGAAEPLLKAAARAFAGRGDRDGAASGPARDGASGSGEGGGRVIDIEGLLDAYMGNREFLTVLLRTFVSDGSRRAGDLRRSLAAGDMEDAARALHSLVNIAGSGRAEIALRRLRAWEASLRQARRPSEASERAALEAFDRALEAAAGILPGLEGRA